jgi:hypothetical protein
VSLGPIDNLTRRIAVLEAQLNQLQTAPIAQPLLAQLATSRDVRLIKTCEIPAEGEEEEGTYPERTPEDDGMPTVFPGRFIDADFLEGEPFDSSVTTDNRTTDDEDLAYFYSVGGLYVPKNTVCAALWQRGLREDDEEEETTYGAWWIIAGGEIFVPCRTTAVHAKGIAQDVALVTDGSSLAATSILFEAMNAFRAMGDDKFGVAVKMLGKYFLIAGDCG